MKKEISKYLLIVLIIIFVIMLGILVYVKFFYSENNKEYSVLKEKGEGEIIYLDTTIIDLLNKLNNISYSRYEVTIKQINEGQQQSDSDSSKQTGEQNMQSEGTGDTSSKDTGSASEVTNQSENKSSKLSQVDSLLNTDYNNIPWEEISYGIETIYTAIPTIKIDMKTLNVSDEDLNNFGVSLDGVAQSIKAKDKNGALTNLYNLYTFLPKFLSAFSNDESKLNIYNTKLNVLNAYVLVNNDKWEDMSLSINSAIDCITKAKSGENILDTEQVSFDKAYTLLQELKNGINVEDKEIFYLKYKLTMEQLEIL